MLLAFLAVGVLDSLHYRPLLPAVAAAWGAGLSWETVRRGLSGFVNDSDNAPGRFNVMDYRGARVIADYGHHPDAMSALVALSLLHI